MFVPRFVASIPLLTLSLVPAASAHERPVHLTTLRPGEFVTQQLKVPIRIVLIGFDQGQIDEGTIRAVLPASYQPIVRYPRFYGLNGRELGLDYAFQYSIVAKTDRFASRLFAYLASTGREGPRTAYQTAYNNQALNVLDVPDTVLHVDAGSVEKWLETHDRGGDEGYTIYFINWYGHEGFRFHVYTKTDEPDPDTHYNFGELRASRKIVSWGGSSGRSWFYDFSAGPEWNGASYVVDQQDLDGNGREDYRIPVIWEYAVPGFRTPDMLSYDAALLTRFVAINLLFTPSPLYDPLVTAPAPFGAKIAHVSMLEDDPDPAQKGVSFMDPAFARAKLQAFEPYYRWRVNLRSIDPIDAGAKRALDIFTGSSTESDCWNAFGTPFAQLFCYFDANRSAYVPSYRSRDYVSPVFSFNTTDAGLGSQAGLLGFSDDNWLNGTQSFVFTFGAPLYRSSGYGFTATTVHELGHHIGVSHPHDGFDAEFGLDYGAADFFYFAWLGDESDTVMHYISLSNGFGVLNRDNMYRWEAAGYLNWSNALAGDILASSDSWKVAPLLRVADTAAWRATHALRGWRYLDAVTSARVAYASLVQAAETLGVTSSSLAAARLALPPERIQKYVCKPRPVEN